MLRIEYFDKERFMRQLSASHGSVLLHLDNGKTCDLKQDSAATELFQMMKAPAKGFSISAAVSAKIQQTASFMSSSWYFCSLRLRISFLLSSRSRNSCRKR